LRSTTRSSAAGIAVAEIEDRDAGRTSQRLLCDRLLRQLAGQLGNSAASDWDVHRIPESAPRVVRASDAFELHASVAHSGHWVAVGLSSASEIGVDIQVEDTRHRWRDIANLVCLPDVAAIDKQHFFACWALREAIAKATSGSVLLPHEVEQELSIAVARRGHVVSARSLSAMVDQIHPHIHLAVVLVQDAPAMLCA
jgi:phosphopantetheinyl transferase